MRVQALILLLIGCQPKENTTFVDVPPASGSAQMILPMASALPQQKVIEPAYGGFRIGDAVEVEWHGDWWPAHVINMSSTFPMTYAIHYDGYGDEWDEWVGLDRIRAFTAH